MEEKNDMIKYFEEIMQREIEAEYEKSYGTAILKNGLMIPIYSKLKMFRDGFLLYSNALTLDDEEKSKKIIQSLNNGIMTNGAVTLDLQDVSAFISADKRDHFQNREASLDDDFMGDSFLGNN